MYISCCAGFHLSPTKKIKLFICVVVYANVRINAILRLTRPKCSLVQNYAKVGLNKLESREWPRLLLAPVLESIMSVSTKKINMEDNITLFRLVRVYMEDCTVGVLYGPEGIICNTIELAWRGNKQEVSCIPEGLYPLLVGHSPKFGAVIRVMAVSGRSGIVFHPANNPHLYSGRRELRGCIAPCMSVSLAMGLSKGINSRAAVERFMSVFLAARMRGKVGLEIKQAVPGTERRL